MDRRRFLQGVAISSLGSLASITPGAAEAPPTSKVEDYFPGAAWIRASDSYFHDWTARIPNSKGGVQKMRVGLAPLPNRAELARQVFYGNGWLNPGESMGFSAYYNTLDPDKAQSAANVLDGGGRGASNSSIYLVVWSPNTCYLAFSQQDDFMAALVPFDWRYAVRMANIDVKTADADLAVLMSCATLYVPRIRGVGEDIRHPVFYMSRAVAEMYISQGGSSVFRSVPVRVIDEIRNDEPQVI
jgi:hypothetical protein